MVDELNESVPGLALAYDEMGESINMDADALERFIEKTAKQEEYEAQVSRLSELYREQAEISARLEAAQILTAIVQGSEDDIAALNEQLAKVEEGKENFSNTAAEMETNFSDRMEEIVQDLEDAIQGMNLADDIYQIGENNIQGLINGTASMKLQLIAEYQEMGRAAAEAYQREVEQASPSKKFKRMGQYDIQGMIQGAETEKPKLAAAYEDAARLALSSMERTLPSSIEVPSASAAINNRTATIMAAQESRSRGADYERFFVSRHTQQQIRHYDAGPEPDDFTAPA